MLEDKIDETNKLLHKMAHDVFPSVFASFEDIDRRLTKLEDFFYQLVEKDEDKKISQNASSTQETDNDETSDQAAVSDQKAPVVKEEQMKDYKESIGSIKSELMKNMETLSLKNGTGPVNDTETAKSLEKLDKAQNKTITVESFTDGLNSALVDVTFEDQTIIRIDDENVKSSTQVWPQDMVKPNDNINSLFERFYFSRIVSKTGMVYNLYQTKIDENNKVSHFINVGDRMTKEDIYDMLMNGGFEGTFIEYIDDKNRYTEEEWKNQSLEVVLEQFQRSHSVIQYDDAFKYFDIGDPLFESYSFEYQKTNTRTPGWPERNTLENELDVSEFVLHLFNIKYSYWVDDRRIIIYIENRIKKKCPDTNSDMYKMIRKCIPSDVFDRKTSMIDWERLLVLAVTKIEYTGMPGIFKYLTIMKERKENIGRVAKNFDLFARSVLFLKDNIDLLEENEENMKNAMSSLQEVFDFEIQYMQIVLPQMAKYRQNSKNGVDQGPKVNIFGRSSVKLFPQGSKQLFESLLQIYNEYKDFVKTLFIEDLKLYVNSEKKNPRIVTAYPPRYEQRLELILHVSATRDMCIMNSRYWDKYYAEELFYLVFHDAAIGFFEKTLKGYEKFYFKYAKYEVLAYINMLPIIIRFLLHELASDHPKWDLEYLKENDLNLSSLFFCTRTPVLVSMLKMVYNVFSTVSFDRYMHKKINLEEIMFEGLSNVAIEHKDCIIELADNLMEDKEFSIDHCVIRETNTKMEDLLTQEKYLRLV